MKGLIQRVSKASVTVDGAEIGAIQRGVLLLLGVEHGDNARCAEELCRKILSYRIFPDDQGRMNRSLLDIEGELLVVPQFTLAADTRSGTRPGFSSAAKPDLANTLFLDFVEYAKGSMDISRVAAGRFGADMKVALINDGPVTFLLEVSGTEA